MLLRVCLSCTASTVTASTVTASTVTPKQSPTQASSATKPTVRAETIAGGVMCRILIVIAVITTLCF